MPKGKRRKKETIINFDNIPDWFGIMFTVEDSKKKIKQTDWMDIELSFNVVDECLLKQEKYSGEADMVILEKAKAIELAALINKHYGVK